MLLKLKLFLKKFLNLIEKTKAIKYSPFSLKEKLSSSKLYSDFFILNTKFARTIFIAENIYSLYKKKDIKVTHEFNFFQKDGKFLQKLNHETEELFSKILLPKITTQSKYISFTHNSYYGKRKNFLNKNLSIQHRGYTIFYKQKNHLGSILHGNTGGISPALVNKTSMVQRNSKFIYTPAYKFLNNAKYDLVFNNPTNKKLQIIIIFNFFNKENSYKNKTIMIDPFGTDFINFSKYEGTISFISKLGICRCLVFKNPDLRDNNFDVFHS